MDAVLTQLQPAPAHRRGADEDELSNEDAAAWGSMGGFGNLGRTGGVQGMSVPRVPDVSVRCSVLWFNFPRFHFRSDPSRTATVKSWLGLSFPSFTIFLIRAPANP